MIARGHRIQALPHTLLSLHGACRHRQSLTRVQTTAPVVLLVFAQLPGIGVENFISEQGLQVKTHR